MSEKAPSQISSERDHKSFNVVKKTAMKAAPMQSATRRPPRAPAQICMRIRLTSRFLVASTRTYRIS